MKHRATATFWVHYDRLSKRERARAEKAFKLLQTDPRHQSLHFKSVGELWSARASLELRALALPSDNGFDWIWIGYHAEYEKLLK